MNKRFYLNNNWKFKITNYPVDQVTIPLKRINKWIPAIVPGTIHTDLLKAGLIEDPFKERNEYKLEWISKSNCVYRTEFNYPGNTDRSSNIKLIFEGIDTVADIYLNTKFLGRSENMFLRYEFNVAQLLKPVNNILELHFKSPVAFSIKREKKYGKLSAALNSYRVHIRKAQYSFGWDWGPAYPTTGIWRPVYLLTEDKAVIQIIKFDTEKLTKTRALLKINFTVLLHTKQQLKAVISLSNEDERFRKEVIVGNQNQYSIGLNITNPKLWWPNGQGKQNLYDLNIRIADNSGNILDEKNKKVGIRKIELQLIEKDKPTFRFRVNNKPIYVKGMNWIPADSFLSRVNEKKYRTLLTFAKNANANMIRVWGGGIYEADEFYDLCDELGLLVWQDFMFVCGVYPEHKQFLTTVTEEIIQNVERLRNHPCIAIWCGNNENEWIWYQKERRSYKEMPGYKIFHEIIPNLMNTLDPSSPYWPTSPFGYDEDPNSQNTGNRHQWEIWSNWIDYTRVKNDKSLFVTEFGFQGPANVETFNKILPFEKRKIQDTTFEYHNKQIEGPERIIRFMASHLPLRIEWNDFNYLAQLNQGFALKTCIEHWRANRNITNGSIIWQLNDCWPVTSWSLIDSESKPKMSYYFIKNVFSKVIFYFSKSNSNLEINLLNEGEEVEVTFKTIIVDLKNGQYLLENSKKISLDKRKYIKLDNLNISSLPEDKNWIIITTLYDSNNNIIHRNFYLEKEWKHTKLPEAGIKFKLSKKSDRKYLVLSTNKPAFFIDVHYPGVTFADRGFILLPDEEKHIEIIIGKGKVIKKNIIKLFSLNDYLEH